MFPIIILDGLDNTGKSLQVSILKDYIASKDIPVHVFHYSNFKTIKDKKTLINYTHKNYLNLINLSISNNCVFVCDRFHLSEFVYGQIYRDYTREEALKSFEIEHKAKTNMMLFTFIDQYENLVKREDGRSFSIDKDKKLKEIELFNEAWNLSKINHKFMIDISKTDIDMTANILKFEVDNYLTNMIQSKDKQINGIYMNIAHEISKMSKAVRSQVGAIIVKNRNIISYGFNGTPHGFDNCCEHKETFKSLPEVLHAESNAITKAAKSGFSTDGADIYVTMSPCFECAKLIIQSGIKNVYYNYAYTDTSGLDLLKKTNINVKQIN